MGEERDASACIQRHQAFARPPPGLASRRVQNVARCCLLFSNFPTFKLRRRTPAKSKPLFCWAIKSKIWKSLAGGEFPRCTGCCSLRSLQTKCVKDGFVLLPLCLVSFLFKKKVRRLNYSTRRRLLFVLLLYCRRVSRLLVVAGKFFVETQPPPSIPPPPHPPPYLFHSFTARFRV
jgi:hypothetical protein